MDFGAFLTTKNKVLVVLLFILFTIVQCQLDETQKRIYRKKITYDGQVISWFYFSNISNISPDLLILESVDGIDTICEVSNLKDIHLNKSELTLFFRGTPRLYETNIVLPKRVQNLEIIIDTFMRDKSQKQP